MKLIKTIKDEDLFDEIPEPENPQPRERKAARAVVFDGDGNVGILHASKYKYHKIPGGGVEDDENIEEALDRECVEEVGAHVSIIQELGLIVEYRNKFNLKQDSYCYLAKVVGEKMQPSFTEKEIGEGFEALWLPLDEAIEIVKNNQPENYEGKFVQARELTFLEEAKNIMKNQAS